MLRLRKVKHKTLHSVVSCQDKGKETNDNINISPLLWLDVRCLPCIMGVRGGNVISEYKLELLLH